MGGVHRGNVNQVGYWYKFHSTKTDKTREFSTLRSAKRWVKAKKETGKLYDELRAPAVEPEQPTCDNSTHKPTCPGDGPSCKTTNPTPDYYAGAYANGRADERARIVRDLSAIAASPNIEQQARLAYLAAIRVARGEA